LMADLGVVRCPCPCLCPGTHACAHACPASVRVRVRCPMRDLIGAWWCPRPPIGNGTRLFCCALLARSGLLKVCGSWPRRGYQTTRAACTAEILVQVTRTQAVAAHDACARGHASRPGVCAGVLAPSWCRVCTSPGVRAARGSRDACLTLRLFCFWHSRARAVCTCA